jgi:hypothetical protein
VMAAQYATPALHCNATGRSEAVLDHFWRNQ